MTSKINWNQTIESKIREFKEGTDYKFIGEEHHRPNMASIANYTIRSYNILSSSLAQTLRKILEKQAAKLMSFDFKGEEAGVNETFEVNDPSSYHCQTDDEFDNMITYRVAGYSKDQGYPSGYLSIHYIDKPERSRDFIKDYQEFAAKFAPNYEKKLTSNGTEQTSNIPPHGTKCEDCDKEISEYDINQGLYQVENTRVGDTVYKLFSHAKKNACREKRSSRRKLENYVYYPNLASEWQKSQQTEWLCRDLLQKTSDKAVNNLIYLESCQKAPWNELREPDIDATKKMVREIEARLQKVKNDGRWNDCDNNCSNCGAKICCHEKDQGCPEKKNENYLKKYLDHDKKGGDKDNNKRKNPGNQNLSAGSAPNENNNKNFLVNFFNEILQWMKQERIVEISLDPVNNKLILENENGIKSYLSDSDLSPISAEVKNYFESSPEVQKSFNRQDLEKQYNQLREEAGQESKANKWILPLSLVGIGVIVLGLIWFIKSQKSKISRK